MTCHCWYTEVGVRVLFGHRWGDLSSKILATRRSTFQQPPPPHEWSSFNQPYPGRVLLFYILRGGLSRGSRCAWWLPQNLVWDNKTYIEWTLEKLHGLKLWFGILKSPDYHCIRPSDKAWEWKTRFGNTYPALFMASVCGKITFCLGSMKDWVSFLCFFVCDAWNKKRWVNVLMSECPDG